MLRFLRYLLITVTSIILVIVLLPWILRGFGFYVDNPGWEVGIIAAEKEDPRICQKIIVYSHIFGPPTMWRRDECIFRYAEITQDPFACEQLMPSEYGLSCINNVISHVYENQTDLGFFDFKECSERQTVSLRRDWCSLLRANRNRSTQECKPIESEALRNSCTVKFQMWEKYPDMRNLDGFGRSASEY